MKKCASKTITLSVHRWREGILISLAFRLMQMHLVEIRGIRPHPTWLTTMLFYLFIVFSSFPVVINGVTCYDCPLIANSFDYLVANDRLPDALRNCTTKSLGDTCIIDVIWNRNPDRTQIALVARDDSRSAALIEHTLSGNINLENKNNQLLWTKSISYTCSTDQCNSLLTLKRLLASLTMKDDLFDLGSLLIREITFDGRCWFWTNSTILECSTVIPAAPCKQCSFQGIGQNGVVDICANCLLDDIGETFLLHEVNFELINRTRADHWVLECQSKNCSTIENGNRILQKSTFDFDFAQFLNHANRMSAWNIAFVLCIVLSFHATSERER